eukprot:COSAG02_NODE_3506_length_6636_cov_14.560808_7_plen_136_part_00
MGMDQWRGEGMVAQVRWLMAGPWTVWVRLWVDGWPSVGLSSWAGEGIMMQAGPLCVCVCVCVPRSARADLPACLPACLSVCRSVGLSVCRSVGLSVCRSVGLRGFLCARNAPGCPGAATAQLSIGVWFLWQPACS